MSFQILGAQQKNLLCQKLLLQRGTVNKFWLTERRRPLASRCPYDSGAFIQLFVYGCAVGYAIVILFHHSVRKHALRDPYTEHYWEFALFC